MTYFILNHRISGEQQLVQGKSIASDHTLIFKGSLEDLTSQGFSVNQVGGFELINNILIFNQSLKDEQLQAQKPLLSGSELDKKLRSLFKGRAIKARATLLSPVLTYLDIMKSDDEIIQSEYDELKTELILGIGDNLTIEEITQIEQILDDFVSGFRL